MSGVNNKQDYFVSVVSVLNNNKPIIEDYLKQLSDILEKNYMDYEIVLIDQCSSDGTVALMDNVLKELPSIRYIRLNQIVHDDVALAAGLENAIGDFVVLLKPDRDPVDCIPELVNLCREGYDIVIGVSHHRRSIGYRFIRPYIQWLLNWIGYYLPKNATTLRCLSRRCVNTVTSIGRFHLQFFVRISKTGYPSCSYTYNQNIEYAKKETLIHGIVQTCRLLIFNSTKPLRWMAVLGFAGSLLAFLIAFYSIAVRLFVSKVVEGWTSTILFMSVMFMILFSMLAFFGEYLSRLLDYSGEYQDYSIVYEKNSSVMLNENRYNVLDDSVASQINKVQTRRNG